MKVVKYDAAQPTLDYDGNRQAPEKPEQKRSVPEDWHVYDAAGNELRWF